METKSDNKFLLIINIFFAEFRSFRKTFFVLGMEIKDWTISVDDSLFSRFFINSTNENILYNHYLWKRILDIILLFNHPIFFFNLIGVYALKSKVFISFKRSIANSRVFLLIRNL